MYIYIYIYHIRIYLCVYSPSLEKGTQGLLYKRVGGVPKGYELVWGHSSYLYTILHTFANFKRMPEVFDKYTIQQVHARHLFETTLRQVNYNPWNP